MKKKNKEIKTVSIAKPYCAARIPSLKEFLTMYFNQGCIWVRAARNDK